MQRVSSSMSEENQHRKQCLNCGAVLDGPYCSQCGQKDRDPDLTVREMLGEVGANVFQFDSRLFRTLKALLTRPGLLTERYNAGQRLLYVPPLRLYLVISVIFFFVLSFGEKSYFRVGGVDDDDSGSVEVVALSDSLETAADSLTADTLSADSLTSSQNDDTTAADQSFLEGVAERFWQGMQNASENPQMVNDILLRRFPQMMFVLLPIFALLLMLIYWRRDHLYLHHLIFSLHYHCIAYILLSFASLINTIFDAEWGVVIPLTLPIFLFLSMRRVYGQGLFKTTIKIILLSFSYIFILTCAIIVVALVTILLIQ